ncbi:MAG TPA: hypothetical protein VL947_13025, partial [Cytophagales bacterium]|nr:hypothetical protein [Cytophagales bacterium]
MKRKFSFKVIGLSVCLLGLLNEVSGQCANEVVTVSKWCEGGFAKWDIVDPDPNARYVWYNYFDPATKTASDYSPNGLLKSQAWLDSSTARTFYSPFRVTS